MRPVLSRSEAACVRVMSRMNRVLKTGMRRHPRGCARARGRGPVISLVLHGVNCDVSQGGTPRCGPAGLVATRGWTLSSHSGPWDANELTCPISWAMLARTASGQCGAREAGHRLAMGAVPHSHCELFTERGDSHTVPAQDRIGVSDAQLNATEQARVHPIPSPRREPTHGQRRQVSAQRPPSPPRAHT